MVPWDFGLYGSPEFCGSDRIRYRFRRYERNRFSVQKHVAEALLREGVDLMLAGDVETGKATGGFEKLGRATGTQPKSLIRMFGPRGNPQARNLFNVIGYLQKQAGVELHVALGPT